MNLREPGLWVARYGQKDLNGRPALFLDRDGTITYDRPYLGDPAGAVLNAPVVNLMRSVAKAGHPLIVVTNQSGIARGLISWRDFEDVTARLFDLLQAEGCPPDAVIACGYFSSADRLLDIPDHPLRKPNPGMLELAAREWGISLSGSVIVGDRETDMRAGAAAGLRLGLLLGNEVPQPLDANFTVLRPGEGHSWPEATAAIKDALRGRRSGADP